jgi:bacteriorhodopsin
MADIDIVPKRRTSTWLWVVLAIIVVALIAWMIMGPSSPPAAKAAPSDGLVPVATTPAGPQIRVL